MNNQISISIGFILRLSLCQIFSTLQTYMTILWKVVANFQGKNKNTFEILILNKSYQFIITVRNQISYILNYEQVQKYLVTSSNKGLIKELFFAWVNFRIDIARARRPTVRPRKGNGGVWRKKKNSKILCRFPEFLDAYAKVQFCQL